MLNTILDVCSSQNLKVAKICYYGSHAFGLNNNSSDEDFLVVVVDSYSSYVGLEPVTYKTQFKLNGSDILLVDLKKYHHYLNKPTFNALVSMYSPLWLSGLFNTTVDVNQFSVKRIAHHLLGTLNNNSFNKKYKFYSALLLEYLVTYRQFPQTLDFRDLLSELPNVHYAISASLFAYKNETPIPSDIVLPILHSHNELNSLPDNKINASKMWLNNLERIRNMSDVIIHNNEKDDVSWNS
jgi:predicted nucleotidyltransferase